MSLSTRSRPNSPARPSLRLAGVRALAVLIVISVALPAVAPAARHPSAARVKGKPGANFQAKGLGYIRLAYKAFDPLRTSEPAVPKSLRAIPRAGRASWWLVQLKFPIRRQARDDAVKLASRSGGYIPDGTFILEMTPAQAAKARGLAGVRWVGLLHPAYKLRPTYAGSPGVLEVAGRRDYRAFLFNGEDHEAVIARMRGIRGVSVDAARASSRVIPFRATRDELPAIARIHGVTWVAERPTYVLTNYNARWASDTGERDVFSATLAGRLTGAGQTTAVADTGVNYFTDSGGNAHVAFADFYADGTAKLADYVQLSPGNSQNAMFLRQFNGTRHRKMAAYYDLAGDGYEPADAANHGTHTAGSVAADYPDARGRYGTYGGRFDGQDGLAPGARLIVQDVNVGEGGFALPADHYDLFEQAYDANPTQSKGDEPTHEFGRDIHGKEVHSYDPLTDARTHNYSIGSIIPLADLGDAERADAFIWDHQDFVANISASNDGPGIYTVSGSPNISKNTISSCASANGRQPLVTLDSAAVFSSHGPTADQRLKPDVCTPGQIVVSPKGGTSDSDHYLQGTSMSSPVLTGLATLVRQYFFDGFGARPGAGTYAGYAVGAPNKTRRWNPSAALVKAVLINSAERMRGWYTGDEGAERSLDGQWPSAGQGWGRVELDNALAFGGEARRLYVVDVWNKTEQALDFSSADHTVEVTAGEPLEITLVWTDAPSGFEAGTTPLVNNLDLTVTAPDGTTYVGNNFTTQSGLVFNSAPGDPALDIAESRTDAAPPDQKNNVEAVRIEAPIAGTYTVHIDGGEAVTNQVGTPISQQGYALAVSGLVGPRAAPAKAVQEARKPTISGVSIESVASDLAVVTWKTNEPTTGAVITTDAAGSDMRFEDVYNTATIPGVVTPQNENKGEYVDKKAAGTFHEVRLTGLTPGGKYSIRIESTDRAATPNTTTLEAGEFKSTAAMYQPAANDIAEVRDTDPSSGTPLTGDDQNWGVATQLYSGHFTNTPSSPPVVGPTGLPPTRAVPAFMFRLPASVDPSRITGAAVELTGGHDITSHYLDDARYAVSLLDSSVEESWGPGTDFEAVAGAGADAVAAQVTGLRRGAGTKYMFSFSCGDLEGLRQNLAEDTTSTASERRLAFRVESSTEEIESLFSFEPGYGRRSRGLEYRPRLLLEMDGVDPVACRKTAAPMISDVSIQSAESQKPTSVVVSWRTDVPSSSIVLFRKAGTKAWSQTGVPFRTTQHLVVVEGLEPFGRYEFAVRSRTCNGAEATDDNVNRGYALFPEPYSAPHVDQIWSTIDTGAKTATIRWVTDQNTNGVVEYGTSPNALTNRIEEAKTQKPLDEEVQDTDEPVLDRLQPDEEGPVIGRTHEVAIPDITPCTTYYVRVVSTNGVGKKAVSKILTFNTPSDQLKDLAPVETFATGPGGFTVATASEGLPPTTWAFSAGAMRTTIAGAVPGYGSNIETRLISPPYATSGGPLELTFTETLHSEPGFDFATVEYSVDDGGSWRELRSVSGVVATAPTEVKISIPGLPAGNVRIGFRLTSDSNTEVLPGWSVDDVVLRESLPCVGLVKQTAPFRRPARSPLFHPVPLTGPIPAPIPGSVRADADAVTTNIQPASLAARTAGNSICVRVAGTRVTRTLPATGIGLGWMGLVPLGVAITGLAWLRRGRPRFAKR